MITDQHVLAVTEATFDRAVLQARLPALVDFWARWCPPCKWLDPVVEEIRPFVDCLHAGIQARRSCPGGIDVYRRKLAELDSRIGELQSLRDRVAGELRHLEAGPGPGQEGTG